MLEDEPPALNDWRQGDFALGEFVFPVLGFDQAGPVFEGTPALGAAVISQSCDIIRADALRPFVQIAAIVPVTQQQMAEIQNCRKPRFGFVSGLEPHGLVVDFDLVVIARVELVATWTRRIGCRTDRERREFAAALARHKQRFAFPDAFNTALRPLRRWIERRSANSDAGRLLQSIAEIRVRCREWDSAEDLEFICVLKGDPAIAQRQAWAESISQMTAKVTPTYPEAFFRLATLSELTAIEYTESDRLDLDGLSDA